MKGGAQEEARQAITCSVMASAPLVPPPLPLLGDSATEGGSLQQLDNPPPPFTAKVPAGAQVPNATITILCCSGVGSKACSDPAPPAPRFPRCGAELGKTCTREFEILKFVLNIKKEFYLF